MKRELGGMKAGTEWDETGNWAGCWRPESPAGRAFQAALSFISY